MKKYTEEEKKTMRAQVYDMERQQMLGVLFVIIEGSDIHYAIDAALQVRHPKLPT